MKIKKEKNTTKIWLSANDTFKWSRRPNAHWPCSTLADRRVYVELDKNKDVIDIKINGRSQREVDAHELRCCLNDLTKGR